MGFNYYYYVLNASPILPSGEPPFLHQKKQRFVGLAAHRGNTSKTPESILTISSWVRAFYHLPQGETHRGESVSAIKRFLAMCGEPPFLQSTPHIHSEITWR